MILGSLSFTTDTSRQAEQIHHACSYPGLEYHQLSFPFFSGGFLLNRRLPWTMNDFVYSSKEDDIFILMSGSIYNRQELLNGLTPDNTPGDPALVARLFLSEGAGFVRGLNGDFAICLVRPDRKQAFLFRDHVGIRPIAYVYEGKSLSFSSDFVGLSRSCCKGEGIAEDYLIKFFRYTDYRKSPCSGVIKLLPGHYMEFTEAGIKLTEYWKPETIKTDHTLTPEKMLSDLSLILEDSVRIRSDKRFTAGAHVSGGLDSGVVAVLARREYSTQESFKGFSWSPRKYEVHDTDAADERELVKKLSAGAGIDPVFSDIGQEEFINALESLYEYYSYISEYLTSDQAVRSGTNLIFSGWGGDEFISTGVTAIEADLFKEFRLRLFFRRNRIFPLRLFIKRFLYCIAYPALGILDRNTAMNFKADTKYLKRSHKKASRESIRNFHFNTSRRKFHIRMLKYYHLQQRCEHWTRGGYRKGLEYRYPLLDKRIIEYMISVPSELLCITDQFRPLLRILGKNLLPEEVLTNYSKRDPVHMALINELFSEVTPLFFSEVRSWRANPDFHFVDFTLLEKDIENYRNGQGNMDGQTLLRTLFYLKGLHELCRRYHEPLPRTSGE